MHTDPRKPGARWHEKLRIRMFSCAATLLLTLALSGCQSVQTSSTQVAEIRFVNASPDITLPGIDFYLNGTAAIYNVGYRSHSSYIPVTPGTYALAAHATGTTQTLVSSSATLANGHTYTFMVGNQLVNLSATLLQDQATPAPSGEVSLRLIDQASRAGAVDVYAIPAGATLLTTTPIQTSVTAGENTGYFSIPANTYTLAILPAGTTPTSTTVALYTGTATGYTAGVVDTLILTDPQTSATAAVQVFSVPDAL